MSTAAVRTCEDGDRLVGPPSSLARSAELFSASSGRVLSIATALPRVGWGCHEGLLVGLRALHAAGTDERGNRFIPENGGTRGPGLLEDPVEPGANCLP